MKCHECNKGTIQKVIVKEYKAKLKGITFPVENAEIGKCDTCDAELYSAKEIQRWEQVLDEYLIASGLLLKPEQITEIRESLKLSVIDFAQLLGVTRQAVYGWERNDTKPLSIGPTGLLLSLLQAEKNKEIYGITDFLISSATGRGIKIQTACENKPAIIKFPHLKNVPLGGPGFAHSN